MPVVPSGIQNQNRQSPESHLARFDEDLRQRLVAYFRHRRVSPSDAEDLTHEVYIRLVNIVQKGVEVSDPRHFVFGIAQNVFREWLRQLRREARPFSTLSPQEMDGAANVREERLNPAPRLEEEELNRIKTDAYRQALDELSPAKRKLLIDYYPGSAAPKDLIRARRELAAKLGIAHNNLRLVVHRLRSSVREAAREKIYRETGERLE